MIIKCVNCGTLVDTDREACCSGCGAPVIPAQPVQQPQPVQYQPVYQPEYQPQPAEQPRPAEKPAPKNFADRVKYGADDFVSRNVKKPDRLRKILFIAFIVGICMLVIGITGRIVINTAAGAALKANNITADNFEYYDEEYKSGTGKKVYNLMKKTERSYVTDYLQLDIGGMKDAVVDCYEDMDDILKDDSSYYKKLAKRTEEEYDEMDKSDRKIKVMYLEMAHEQNKKDVGGFGFFFLKFFAYNSTFIVLGIIIAILSAALWLLAGGRPGEVAGLLRSRPSLVCGAVIALQIIIIIISVIAINANVSDYRNFPTP